MAKLLTAACLVAALMLTAQAAPDSTAAEMIGSHGDFSILASLVEKAGLADKLGKDFSGTVLAPTNAAFAEFEAQLEAHGRNETADSVPKDVLAGMLSDHVSADSLTMPLQDGKTISTLRGKDLTVHVHDGITTLVGNGVATALTLAPIKAGGATIIPIDTVLQYITMASSANSRRNLLSTRHLLCSCGGLSGCCGSGCACCTGCSGLYCNC